ncbi:acyl-CoA carboxylase epsilon subunit-like protein [Georgenia soli]|uniref:Acyl-CoA carboxylase epsilon subunit-like protein n=1 Tax=Georgenia soli TaxID=638953 RepID=A0A2A9EJM9_9MICO|nr:acyl-CoA carboxylase subunit epsilon [Georgenia soli]PFG38731.1 acyl-CoA carboxylase epsilon subunit-like protein [Georgenia soli]
MTTVDDSLASAPSPAEWSGGGNDYVVASALGSLGTTADGGPPLMTSPAVRVVHGRPDDLELAALVAGIVAARGRVDELGGLPDDAAETVRTRWTDRARVLGAAPTPGAGAWRWSLHP